MLYVSFIAIYVKKNIKIGVISHKVFGSSWLLTLGGDFFNHKMVTAAFTSLSLELELGEKDALIGWSDGLTEVKSDTDFCTPLFLS